jgi:hypothetical protein
MIKDRYRYPIFASGMLIMILAALLYKYAGLPLDAGEIAVAIGASLFVISMIPRIRKEKV